MGATHTDVKQVEIETPFKAQTLKMRPSSRDKRKQELMKMQEASMKRCHYTLRSSSFLTDDMFLV